MRHYILYFYFLALPLCVSAQKISIGTCTIEEMGVKGTYKGEMSSGKPNGKGSEVFENEIGRAHV